MQTPFPSPHTRTLTGDTELDNKSASIAFVGKDVPFQIIENESIQKYLDLIVVEGEGEMETDAIIENPVV